MRNLQLKINFSLLTILTILTFSFQINAATIYVAADAPAGGNGTDWAQAYNDLQSALGTAIAGDEIWIKNGTYHPTSSADRTISFELVSGVALYGGFAGTETQRNQRDKINTTTYLSGDIGTQGDKTDNSYSIIYSIDVNSNTIVSGLIITLGNADHTYIDRHKNGGAWFNNGNTNSNPTINYVQFIDNVSSNNGGALYNAIVASPSIQHSLFENNIATISGGAIFNDGNAANANASPSIFKTEFIENLALFGGAIYNSGNTGKSSPSITSSLFENNRVSGGGSIGAAIYSFGKSGGESNVKIINSIFDRNSATGSAGAIYTNANDGTAITTILNSTFYLNTAATGGAIYLNEIGTGVGEVDIKNSIFFANSASYDPNFHMTADMGTTPTISLEYSLIDAVDCADVMNLPPTAILNCNSGILYNLIPKFTNANAGDFTLKPTSPAINVGNNTPVNACNVTEDMASYLRIAQSTVDLGPYESASILPIELLHFTARFEKDYVKTYWATASEINNDYFTIERSKDGINFEAIDQISGAGFSETTLSYTAIDRNPFAGVNYYRLKQTDFDGVSTYSQIEVVEILDGKIRVYPNPVVNSLHIAMSDFEEGEATYSISNIAGMEITKGITPVNAGVSIIRLDQIHSLQPGSYIVRLYTEKNGAFTTKFIKTRM